ncbi:hypothetical protein SKAU_G00335040 [Synaphobranchus kaupii]|uniref:Uncharacterized protein n=1 Tax=Synaphobranchus kaupii TaxID=118154 RepID=A0A9Q1ELX1_SYNKA|nr:hypothetical protein SKAU_G00335040 [Synaphobranchus kaupii]
MSLHYHNSLRVLEAGWCIPSSPSERQRENRFPLSVLALLDGGALTVGRPEAAHVPGVQSGEASGQGAAGAEEKTMSAQTVPDVVTRPGKAAADAERGVSSRYLLREAKPLSLVLAPNTVSFPFKAYYFWGYWGTVWIIPPTGHFKE